MKVTRIIQSLPPNDTYIGNHHQNCCFCRGGIGLYGPLCRIPYEQCCMCGHKRQSYRQHHGCRRQEWTPFFRRF